MGGLGIGDDTAYTVTDDERTIVKFDPATGRVGWVRHVLSGKIWVSTVTSNGEIVMQYQGPLLDENYTPVPDAPVSPNPVAVIK
jgi:outer membrane protein assembly factor BamB